MSYSEITQVIGYAQHDRYHACWVFGLTADGSFLACNHGANRYNERLVSNQKELTNLINWFQDKGWQYASLSDIQAEYWKPDDPYANFVTFSPNEASEWNKALALLPDSLIPRKPRHTVFPKVPSSWNRSPAVLPFKGAKTPPLVGEDLLDRIRATGGTEVDIAHACGYTYVSNNPPSPNNIRWTEFHSAVKEAKCLVSR